MHDLVFKSTPTVTREKFAAVVAAREMGGDRGRLAKMPSIPRPLAALLLMLLLAPMSSARADDAARAAVERALPLLQRSAATFVAQRGCVSCHHNALTVTTLRMADRRGIDIDAGTLDAVETRTFRALRGEKAVDDAVQTVGLSDPTPNDSFMLMAAHDAGLPAGLATAVYARRLAHWQRADGRWMTSDFRPPHSSSELTATASAVRALRAYMPAELAGERDAAIRRAAAWLARSRPQSTEDATFRVLGLVWSDAPRSTIETAARDLLALQGPDGGWPQLPAYAGDAYSTGEALYALRMSGMPPAAPEWQRGERFLVSTQADDGTWHIGTRMISPAEVSPPYFTTGFPYGKDEYISYAGSCWAVMALLSSLPETPGTIRPASAGTIPDATTGTIPAPSPRPLPTASPDIRPGAQRNLPEPAGADRSAPSWPRTALFGSANALAKLLEAGLDPNAATTHGTTPLMAAALDADKLRLLLARGADPRARSEDGFDALTIAASHVDTLASVRALLEAGAEAQPPDGVEVRRTPLVAAALAGNADTVRLLIRRGAEPSSEALAEAVTFGHADVVAALLDAGADPIGVDGSGINLLHWAAITNRWTVVPLLVRAGVPIDDVDDAEFTPLMYAVTIDQGDQRTLEALLRAGADPLVRNSAGRTALEQAEFLEHRDAARAIRDQRRD
jgi:cytohesin